MDLEQIRKQMREGTFGQDVLKNTTEKVSGPVETVSQVVDPDRCPNMDDHTPGKVCDTCETHIGTKELSKVSLYFRQGKSDKMYRIELLELPSGEYQTIAYWGKRKATKLNQQIKYHGGSKSEARRVALKLENEKRNKGYK